MAIGGIGAMGSAGSGINVNAFRLATSANNIANVNTDGFKAGEVATADRGYINDVGQGTRVTATYANPRPGSPASMGLTARGALMENSNTDPAEEITGQMAARAAYGANVSTFRTADDMTRTLLDMKA